jgi:protease PrsW
LPVELITGMVLGLVPVALFLGGLVYLDSYKLVRLSTILRLIGLGGVAALLSYFVNQLMVGPSEESRLLVTRYWAPLVEEVLKAAPLLFLLMRRRIGFLVDAAIFGFAIGTGFALVENLYYLAAIENATALLWLIRGCGTAIMHGATTAIVAIIAKLLSERLDSERLMVFLPGLAVAFIIHSTFNHFLISPLLSAMIIVVVLPPLVVIVFAQSERWLQSWIGTGFDLDANLLQEMQSGTFAASRAGRYLQSLRERFDGAIVADMLCYLRLYAELSLRAKGMLMMRENGFPVRKDAAVEEKLEELRYLEQSIGKTGRLALMPVLNASRRDLWQLHLLKTEG